MDRPSATVLAGTGIALFLGGRALAQAAATETAAEGGSAGEPGGGFWDVVLSGNWFGIAILIVLVLLSMLAVYLVVEQILTLRRREVMPEGLAEEVRQFLAAGRLKDADAACRQHP
ncbi:MAG: hypothetical protein D6753_17720, partial [Planctomycetota bacterium]